MKLQTMALNNNIFNTFRSFFIESNLIYDSNTWIPTFIFSVLYYKSFIISSAASKNKPKI